MKHIKHILLVLTLAFTYSQAHAWVEIELGKPIEVTNKNECIKAIEKGGLLQNSFLGEFYTEGYNASYYLYKGFVYHVGFKTYNKKFNGISIDCYEKRSLGN